MSIIVTDKASPMPIVRPGPNVNNSLSTSDVLVGKQLYLQIALVDNYASTEMKVGVRFTRKMTSVPRRSEYASY